MVGLQYQTALRDRTAVRLVDGQGSAPITVEPPNADRSSKVFGTPEISSNLEVKFRTDDALLLVNPYRSSCTSAEVSKPRTVFAAETARDFGANEVAIGTIWLFFFALLIGLATSTPLLPAAINLPVPH
jgi:hypothetical protein